MSGALLNLFPHIVVAIEIEYICDKVQRILVILNIGVEAGQVKAVSEIVFVDLTEIFVASRGDELLEL